MEIPSQTTDSAESGKARRKPGTRRLQILQTLATMLEDPRGEKVTTAALAAKLDVSEAALYRHFASKAQMFEGLLEFAQTNRGMTRVLIGDALVNENDRLQDRMNQLLERIEASLRQSLRVSVSQGEMAPDLDTSARAALAVAFVLGRWHRFAKSGFRKQPTDGLEIQLITLIGAPT